MMATGCARPSDSQLLPANGPLALLRVHKSSVVEKAIYSFRGGTGSTADGANPHAGLVDVNGTLFGTTLQGGNYALQRDRRGFGTVFSVSPHGTEKVLHRFGGGGDGKYPNAGLIEVNGTLYGTSRGAGKGNGTVFSIVPDGSEAVVHAFSGGDGKYPEASLLNVNGALYGTTVGGGGKCDCGTVFSVSTTGKFTLLHRFGRAGDGDAPYAGLVFIDGKLYGTTDGQNLSGASGTVFSITPKGEEKILHSFKGGTSDGSHPMARLLNVNGALYGTTETGGSYDAGTVFSITPSAPKK